MGFEEDRKGPEDKAAEAVIRDYVRRAQMARGELPQREHPVCPECSHRHSPHYDCGK